MEVVNPFILKNKERMIVFLDQLSSISDPFMPSGVIDLCNNSNSSSNSDTGKSTRVKQHICEETNFY